MLSRNFRTWVVFLLTLVLTGLQGGQVARSAVACGSQVEFLSSPVFAIDIGNSYLANYIGYKVTPTSSSSNLWVKISNMSGPVTLTSTQSEKIRLGSVTGGTSAHAFFHAKAPAANNTADSSHVVSLFNGDPDAAGSEICTSSNLFTEVADTQEASPNKVDSIQVSTSGAGVGVQTAVALVSGDTGTVAANGEWMLSPAPFINFPSDQWRLVSTKLETNVVGGTPSRTLNNILYINSVPNSDEGEYRATFTFLSIAPATSTTNLTPISYITSGGPLKFTGTLPTVGSVSAQALPVASDCVITFEPNGPVSSTQSQTVTCDSATNLTSNTFTYAGFSFTGWNTAADGTGTSYSNNQSISTSAGLTLYAQWSAVSTYTVTYNANSATTGTVPTDAGSYASGATVTVLGNTGSLTKTGYTFNGWCTTQPAAGASCSGTSQAAASTFAMGSANTTLYAVWSPASQSITYDNNGGAGSISSTTGNTGSSINLSNGSGFTRAGYTLASWNTAANGSGTSYTLGQSSLTMPAEGLSLYAIWSANTLNVTFDTQGGSSITSTTTTTGASLSDPGTPTRAGYTFNGWFVASTGGSALSFAYAHGRTADFTLYAQWSAVLPIEPISKLGNLQFEVLFDMNGIKLDSGDKRLIRNAYLSIKNRLTAKSVVTVEVTGWVQPTNRSPNVSYLSVNRAKAVVDYLRKLGLNADYKIQAPGHDRRNVAFSRRASAIVNWTFSK
jgi:uncharacterized repeat protein (TIGR02543 family)